MSDLVPEDNFDIYQGSARTFTWLLTNNNDVPIDLTSYSAKLEIRDKPGGSVISSLTSSSGITLGGTAGTITPAWTGAQTALFSFDKAVYDLFLTPSGGQPTALVHGTITLLPRVTQ